MTNGIAATTDTWTVETTDMTIVIATDVIAKIAREERKGKVSVVIVSPPPVSLRLHLSLRLPSVSAFRCH
jgi:hypothetical protein